MQIKGNFNGLFADAAETARIELLHPGTGKVLRDANGEPAWIEVWPTDSERGRTFDKAQRRKNAEAAEAPDQFDVAVARCAKLTKAWRLLDLSGNEIDTPCTADNALELYSAPNPIAASIYRQVLVGIGGAQNFISAPPAS
jgi:hypothetical protein